MSAALHYLIFVIKLRYHYTNAKKLNVLAEEEEPTVEELKSRKKKGEEEEEVSSVYEGQQWSLGK